MSQSLAERLRVLCDELRSLGLSEAVAPIEATLDEPLRLAVVGRVNAGKSTLVNALVGRRVAPTAAGECTRVVTWYQFGSPDRAVLVLRDGQQRHLPLVEGRLPTELGVPADQVRRLEVFLQSAALRHKTLIDTPGLSSATTTVSQAAAADADALLFLFREAERLDEFTFLREFATACGPFASAGVNVAGVLAQADLTGSGAEDPFPLAAGVAERLAGDHARELVGVVPVAGLLAQTSRTGHLTDEDARTLAALQGIDPTRLRLALSGHLPLDGVDPALLASLVARLGPYALAHVPPIATDARSVLEQVDRWSGLAGLERLIATELEARATLLKGARALVALRRIARGTPSAEARVEAAELDPVAHPFRELAVLQRLRAEDPDSGALEPLLDEVRTPPGASGDWARASAVALGEATMALSPAEAEAWRVLARSRQIRDERQRREALQDTHPRTLLPVMGSGVMGSGGPDAALKKE